MAQRTVDEAFRELLARSVPTATQRTAAAAHRASIESALDPLGVYTLWETGSFHHGTGVRGHSDVDVLVSLHGTRPTNADTALFRVRDALCARFPYTPIRVSRPAVVVDFAGGDERWEVIPGYIQREEQGSPVYLIPAPGGTWIETAPKAHLSYVNSQNASPSGGAKSLARLMKVYKYANFSHFKVSSFYLEMRAAQYMADETAYIPSLDFLRLSNRLVSHELAAMTDPTGVTGRIHSASTFTYRAEAMSRLDGNVRRTRDALDLERAGKPDEAFALMQTVFLNRFPSRWY